MAVGRPLRAAAGGVVYHVLNRAAGRRRIFEQPGDYGAFEVVLAEAHQRMAMRTLAYCLMPNHWHLVLWPRKDGDLSKFVSWFTLTHTQRWHARHGTAGTGHLYQGRFRAFPVQADDHFLVVCRYVERNALRAGLVERAEDWPWCSLRRHGLAGTPQPTWLSPWSVERPSDWLAWVNQTQTASELEALRSCVARGRPFGADPWVKRTARRLGLEGTLRPRGRPKRYAGRTEVGKTVSN
jgi:putative transposase